MRTVGFGVLPMLNSSGVDDALLFWRWSPDWTVLDVVATWDEKYAVWAHLPSQRDWAHPFKPTAQERVRPASFDNIVSAVQPQPRHMLLRPTAGDVANPEWFGLGEG